MGKGVPIRSAHFPSAGFRVAQQGKLKVGSQKVEAGERARGRMGDLVSASFQKTSLYI